MNFKGACRLCCSREGVTYDLFSPCEDGVCLAEELFSLLNIKLSKEDELPESICANCYKVNTFFKEFKENCSQVDSYLKKRCTKDESAPERIPIKTEKEDDYVDQSVAPADRPDDDKAESSTNADASNPVSLLHTTSNENLEELRGNFLSTKMTREGERRTSDAVQGERAQATEETTTPQRREKRKLDEVDAVSKKRRATSSGSYDYVNHVVKQEEVDIYDSPIEDSNDAGSLEDPMSPLPDQLSNVSPIVRSPSPSDPDEDSCSTSSWCSSDSEEDVEMVMLLALLL